MGPSGCAVGRFLSILAKLAESRERMFQAADILCAVFWFDQVGGVLRMVALARYLNAAPMKVCDLRKAPHETRSLSRLTKSKQLISNLIVKLQFLRE